jgi:hypothetical protein
VLHVLHNMQAYTHTCYCLSTHSKPSLQRLLPICTSCACQLQAIEMLKLAP